MLWSFNVAEAQEKCAAVEPGRNSCTNAKSKFLQCGVPLTLAACASPAMEVANNLGLTLDW
eukprot:1021636-Amphidinium_carterae.1